jgi:NAD-dependent deacetylase sirtuin 2
MSSGMGGYFTKPGSDVGGVLTRDVFVQNLKDGFYKNIIIMCGAGISTAAGIPDFRSPSAGLYFKLQKYNLPYPEAVFDGGYFRKNPLPFYSLCRELYPEKLTPTTTHKFFTLLRNKNLLRRVYTQNIDALEFLAGLNKDEVIEAHGSFQRSYCTSGNCGKEYDLQWLKTEIFNPEKNDGVPKCEDCQSVVRPDIVLFGEQLPSRFHDSLSADFSACDLLIVLGTSLAVSPFNTLVGRTKPGVPRVYINKTKPGKVEGIVGWMLALSTNVDFSRNEDLFLQGYCDDIVSDICSDASWSEELEKIEVKSME